MLNTATPTAAAEELPVADKPAMKKSPAVKKSAPRKSPAAKTKTSAKKVVRKSAKTKQVTKGTPKAADKTKPTKAAKQTKQVKPKIAKPKISKADKPKKPKLVRDSFTMPAQEYALLAQVKKACHADGIAIKKSELLRIGVAQLAALSMKKLKAAQAALTPLRAGRPKKHK